MKITRVDGAKGLHVIANRIEIEHEGVSYTITPDSTRGVLIHKKEGAIYVRPHCSNEIFIK